MNAKNTTISTVTIVAPTGVDNKMDINMPIVVLATEMIAALMMTDWKLLNTLIAQSAGNTIKAEVNNEPAKFIAKTMTIAVAIAINMLYAAVFIPAEAAKSSSNVSANILL